MKKIKLTTVIEVDDSISIDDFMIKRTVGQLGEILSYEALDYNEDAVNSKSEEINKVIDDVPVSEIVQFIEESNKIYYGSLSLFNRKAIALAILNSANNEKISNNQNMKDKFTLSFVEKFELEESNVKTLQGQTSNDELFDVLKNKFLEGDFIQMLIYIWEKILSKGEEEDESEIQLVENAAEKYSLESQNINETKKLGTERSKIARAIDSILSGKTAYNKLKAFEKNVLIGLLLTECSSVGGAISPENLKDLKKLLNDQLNISSNAAVVLLEKKLSESLLKKVDQVEVYREKYELVEFLWEKVLSSEIDIDGNGETLIRKMIRKLDISDIESEGARKEAEENLKEASD